MDDYVVERHKRYHTGYPEWYEYYQLQWDVENLKKETFEKLHHFQVDATIDAIVLIEGIFLQRMEWRNFYDFILFVDCPRETRFKRIAERSSYAGDLETRRALYNRRYWLGEDHHLENVRPIQNADLVYSVENSS